MRNVQKGKLLYSRLLFASNIMRKDVVQTCSRKKIKAAELKTFHLPQSQKMRTLKSYLTGRQNAAKLTQKMRLVIHLHFDCSKWTSNNVLTDLENIDRSSKVTVMDAISRYPSILQKAACTVTALPSTQVNVERLFSALRIIRSDLRTSIVYCFRNKCFEFTELCG